ncbi:MAG: acyl-CoA dehydrogenase family protein [Pseudomonadota bacterium]
MFTPNEDQALLAESVGKFIARHYTDEARLGMGSTAHNEPVWREIAEQGWLMLPFAEDFGGLRSAGETGSGEMGARETGAGDMVTLFEALGPGVIVEPVLASAILGGGLMYHTPHAERHKDRIAQIASGEVRAAAALHEARARHDLFYCETSAEKTGEGWRLRGAKSLALGGASADVFVVLARAEGAPGSGAAGLGLWAVPAGIAGLNAVPYRLRDDHWAADLKLEDVTVPDEALLAGPGEAEAAVHRVLDATRLCLAAESVGLMQRALATSIAYSKDRRQFGKAIGEFQVIQHYLVDMSNALEQAKSLVYAAASLADQGWTLEARKAVNRAFIATSEAGMQVVKKAVQIHGGMGVTEEMPLGRLLRRQTAISVLFPPT